MTWKQFLNRLHKIIKSTPTPTPTPTPTLLVHNELRRKANLPPYTSNTMLNNAAQNHANLMALRGEMSHQLAGEPDLGSRLHNTGYSFKNTGENIAYNQRSLVELMNDWMNSSGHRANILSNVYTEAGFAVAYGNNGSPYYCSVFGLPARGSVSYIISDPEINNRTSSITINT